MSAAAALRFRSGQGFRCTPQAYAEPAHSCGVVYFGANGAYVLSVSILFSSGENRTVFVMFCLCSTEALRRAAALGFGSIEAQGKFNYGQRRYAALPVWRDGRRRKERLLDGPRAVRCCPFEEMVDAKMHSPNDLRRCAA